jgi:hypothetical protein
MPMKKKWYQKIPTPLLVAFIAGIFSIIVALIGRNGIREEAVLPQRNTVQPNNNTLPVNGGSTVKKITDHSQPISEEKISRVQIDSVISNELSSKILNDKLTSARNYFRGGSIDNIEKSIQLYHSIISELSTHAKEKLDKNLLQEAETAYYNSQNDDAARKYNALFINY